MTPPKSKSLTQAEVDALPDGTPIIVIWEGCYTSSRYRVGRGSFAPSRTYAMQLTGEMCSYIGERVGPAPLTQVWLDPGSPAVRIAAVGERV